MITNIKRTGIKLYQHYYCAPKNISKSAGVFAAVMVSMCGIGTANAQSHLNGNWIIGDGNGVLEIQGSRWNHPEHGTATIRYGHGSADLEVFYNVAQGIRCAYRAYVIEYGKQLVLEPADSTQPSEYCPQGKLARATGRLQ